jgi:hypothetical protein
MAKRFMYFSYYWSLILFLNYTKIYKIIQNSTTLITKLNIKYPDLNYNKNSNFYI